MKRRIIEIDQDKCNGCGACAAACHEGAIAMVDGKAKLMRDDYCDGLGDCLPTCPTGAITFVEREAAAYDEQAVMENKQRKMRKEGMTLPCGCPGSQSRNIQREAAPAVETPQAQQTSRLSQWPVQIKLVPVNAPYFDGARLLIAADCTAYAYAAFHERFIKGHITLVGCPKLDGVDYSEKLTEIIRASIPAKVRATGGHPAKRTFQAIRIELNRELDVLEDSIDTMIERLAPGGRLSIITFHSLEDRIVKNRFRTNENPCICPPDFPVCVCGRKSRGRVITRKPILPTDQEMEENPRSKSAKLRVFEKS